MAREAFDHHASPLWSRRLTEWTMVVLILLALMWAFDRESRGLQGQSEKVLVWSTLSALRTAVVINGLARHVRPGDRALMEKNPFRMLEVMPPNFAGEMPMRDVYQVAPGSWVFDPECGCVGYRLLHPQWLEPAQETGTIWFRMGMANTNFRFAPLADYRWFGKPLT